MSPSKGGDKDRLGDLMICEVQKLPWNARASLISPVSSWVGGVLSLRPYCAKRPHRNPGGLVEFCCRIDL